MTDTEARYGITTKKPNSGSEKEHLNQISINKRPGRNTPNVR